MLCKHLHYLFCINKTEIFDAKITTQKGMKCIECVNVSGIPQCRFTDIRQPSYMFPQLNKEKPRDDRNINNSSFKNTLTKYVNFFNK